MQNDSLKNTILIVDDNPKNIHLIMEILQKDYSIIAATSGERALDIVINKKMPDLILLDIMMPGCNGYKVCKTLKKIPELHEIPVIFITAKKGPDDIVAGFKCGAVDYISKPFNALELQSRVRTHITIHNLQTTLMKKLLEIEQLNSDLQYKNQKLESISNTDFLSRIYNRRYFDNALKKEWSRHQRIKEYISLIMCDIDHFKQFNDTYGHQAGDNCIYAIAQAIKEHAKRPFDIPARYGGEEFCLILPQTYSGGALAIAEAIQCKIADLKIPHLTSSVKDIVTVSFGIGTMMPDNGHDSTAIISLADKALYKSKQKGRNRITTKR